jgi:CheY-like chemotaxis protein
MIAKPILLVEDDKNDVFFFQRAMDNAGMLIPLQVAQDGQEAIDYLKGAGKFADRSEYPLPALLLLDLKLPFVMGLDVLKWIRQQSDLPLIVLILSSSQYPGDIATAYRLGANGYLVKPPEVSKLQNLAKAINDFWLIQNTSPPDCMLDHRTKIPANPSAERLAVHPWASASASCAHQRPDECCNSATL